MVNITHQKILDLLLKSKGLKKINILDFGCGDGAFLNILPSSYVNNYVGIDINKDSLLKAKRNHLNKKYCQFYFYNKEKKLHLPKDFFDAVILIGTIQYFNKNEFVGAFSEIHNSLKKDGVIILSTTSDHIFYKLFSVYKYFLPHQYYKSSTLKSNFEKLCFKVTYLIEKGFFFSPLFSNFIVFFFDACDKLINKSKGELGPIGSWIRKIVNPLIKFEFSLPIKTGYTIFLIAKKND